MALIVADNVLETTTTTGTGALTLAGAVAGFRDFDSVCANNDTCYYSLYAVDANGNRSGAWEVGLGTFTDTDTLTRTSVHASSNAGAAVNFAAGTKYVQLDATATYLATFQPLDSDLTAIAALTTTSYGRALLTAASGADIKPRECIIIAISDETTTITTGTAKVTFRMPYAFTLTAVRASLSTASSSGTPTFDINEGGTTILSTKLTIDANELTSTTAASAAVISDTALADDAEITIDVDTAGTGAKGAKIYLIGTRS